MMNNLDKLFDATIPTYKFSTTDIGHIPQFGSVIYSVFLDQSEFIYVGISGVDKSRRPRKRLSNHGSGRRSGDQFCVYVQDFYVIPTLLNKPYTPRKGLLDELTRNFIQSRLSYRFLCFDSDDSIAQVRKLEDEIKRGIHGQPIPFLNGIQPK